MKASRAGKGSFELGEQAVVVGRQSPWLERCNLARRPFCGHGAELSRTRGWNGGGDSYRSGVALCPSDQILKDGAPLLPVLGGRTAVIDDEQHRLAANAASGMRSKKGMRYSENDKGSEQQSESHQPPR